MAGDQLIQVLEGTGTDGLPMELYFSTVRKGEPGKMVLLHRA